MLLTQYYELKFVFFVLLKSIDDSHLFGSVLMVFFILHEIICLVSTSHHSQQRRCSRCKWAVHDPLCLTPDIQCLTSVMFTGKPGNQINSNEVEHFVFTKSMCNGRLRLLLMEWAKSHWVFDAFALSSKWFVKDS